MLQKDETVFATGDQIYGPLNWVHITVMSLGIQSTFVISKSKGPSETFRDIRTSTYQMCRIEKNTNRTTKFHK